MVIDLKLKIAFGIVAIFASHTIVTSICAYYGVDQGYAHITHGIAGGWFIRSIV